MTPWLAPITVSHYLAVGAILFVSGIVCMAVKRNALGGGQRHLFSKCAASGWEGGCKEFYFAGDVLKFRVTDFDASASVTWIGSGKPILTSFV